MRRAVGARLRAMGLSRERLIARKRAPTRASQIMDDGFNPSQRHRHERCLVQPRLDATQRRSALAREKLSRQRPPPKRALRRGVR
ncbi:hypothetical protein D0A39_09260 [Xanthomonas campestris pv. campestris]|nr:hypothetical protein D0A39_09260 [Xanthomonas campestris pv. campestris]